MKCILSDLFVYINSEGGIWLPEQRVRPAASKRIVSLLPGGDRMVPAVIRVL